MDMHDFDPREPDDRQDDAPENREPWQDRDDGHYPYEDYYDPDFRGQPQDDREDGDPWGDRDAHPHRDDDHRRNRKPKRRNSLIPAAVFAGILVVGCLAAVLVNDVTGTSSNGMQLQTDSASSAAAAPAESSTPQLDDTQLQEIPDEEAEPLPETNLGSGTVLHISQTPDTTGEAITSDVPDGALSFQEIYQKVIPSVVSITSTLSGGTATGTGIIMSEDGYIITNYHVIDGAEHLTVLLHDDTEYVAALVGGDESSDLAVLKIDAAGLEAAEFGSSASLQVGDEVVAIGDPLGTELRGTMTNGIISAINRDLQVDDRTMTLIQTNAALNSGNSGGPLINCYGQVIGINTMKMSSYYSSIEGLGFAIPISNAKPIIDELIEQGYVSGRPAIGIRIAQDVNTAVRAYYNIPEGVIVQSVTSGSDAAAKGLQAGDVIIAFEGTTVTSSDELKTLLNSYVAGETVRMTIWRNGETFDISIVLMDAHDNT
jgi:serine protease Do